MVFDNADLHYTEKGEIGHYHHYHHPLLQKKLAVAHVPNQYDSEILKQMAVQGEADDQMADGLERQSVPALDVPLVTGNPAVQEDEMLSWLQYPLEDTFDRTYCSELFGELINPHAQLVKDTFLHQTMGETENTNEGSAGPNIEGLGSDHVGLQKLASTHCSRVLNSDAAMAMGAGRAAGLLSQTGVEAFSSVRTAVQPSPVTKSFSSPTEPSLDSKRAFHTLDPVISPLDMKRTSLFSSAPALISSQQQLQHSGFNFPLFSRPVATTLDSLRFVGAASGPTNIERARQPLVKEVSSSCEPSVGDSNPSVVMGVPSCQQSTEFSSQDRGATQGASFILPRQCLPMHLLCRQDIGLQNEMAEVSGHLTGLSGSAVTLSENGLGTVETADTTTSPSRMSGNSIGKIAEEAFTASPKKKFCPAEESEDAEDMAANAKKPPSGRPRAVKRSRAAETHNESEKKRRNKINVRLKALQDLIPNSNKTDKASILDEAIEYTKMLQAQVQFMSMRTGMVFPQMIIPAGMQYLPVQQMPALPHMGMGMGMGLGMGMGMGMNMMDNNAVSAGAGAVAGQAFLKLSPVSGQSLPMHAYRGPRIPPSNSTPIIHDAPGYLPTSCTSEPYNVMPAQQLLQPMHMNMQMNADMYSALLQQKQA